jgi:hypothetical protein
MSKYINLKVGHLISLLGIQLLSSGRSKAIILKLNPPKKALLHKIILFDII